MTWFAENLTQKIYKEMAQFESEKAVWVDFEMWKSQGVKQLEGIWNELGLEFTEQQLQVALERSEAHTNSQEAFKVVPAERLKEMCGDAFQKCVDKCKKYQFKGRD